MVVIKWVAVVLLGALVIIQFFPPRRNNSVEDFPGAISKHLHLPANVQQLLTAACYDCHSNNTNYPWYVNVQPVAWLLADHIRAGKKDLNFDEFGSYSRRRQMSKLKSIAGRIKDGTMPLPSYARMHRAARLTEAEKELITAWALLTKDSLETAK